MIRLILSRSLKHRLLAWTLILNVGWAPLVSWSHANWNGKTSEAVALAHREMWARFIDPFGAVYDYTDFTGRVFLPTAQECREKKPNALGWWTPIENGGFFGGLYLDALCNRWKRLRTPEAAQEARLLAGGLVRLSLVGKTPGFVARGFGGDGAAHYPASSSDQTFPWMYGLWRFATSGIPEGREKQSVVDAMESVALALEKNEWRMPTETEGFGYFGHWSGGFVGTRGTLSGAEPQFDAAVRFLFVLKALHHITGKERWGNRYHEALNSRPRGAEKTRLEICAGGVTYVAPGEPPRYPESPPLWTSASSQAGLRGLLEMESDETVRAQFQRGLDHNARSAARFVGGYRGYDNDNDLVFDIDWRKLNALWTEQAEIGEAVTLATLQYREWNRQSPRRLAEAEKMRDPLFAAWVVVLSGNPDVISPVLSQIEDALRHYRWDRLYTCLFFMSENIYWQALPDLPRNG